MVLLLTMTDLNHPASSTKEDTPEEVTKTASLGGVVPTEKDILCCHGLIAIKNPGNVLFRAIVRTYLPRYNSIFGCNTEASILFWEITQTLQREHGARYLRRQGDVWIVLDDEEARRKTAREVRKQQQQEAQRAMKEEISAIRRKHHQLEQRLMKLGGNKEQPSSRAVGKTIRKKAHGSLRSFKAEISRIMGEESEEDDYKEQQQEDGREEDGAIATSSSTSSSSDGCGSDHEKCWHPSTNILKPLLPNHKKQHPFLNPPSVGEAPASRGGTSSMVLQAVEQVPPSSWSPASSGRRNFLELVSQNRPPNHEEDECSFSTRGRMMTIPQHQQHFLMSGPSSTNYIGDDAYYHRHIDNMNGLHHGSILQGAEERGGGGGRGGVSTAVLCPPPAAATSYYHDHDECHDDDRKDPSLRSKNVPSSSSAARHDHHHRHHQGKQYDYINEDDERLPVADFFLEE